MKTSEIEAWVFQIVDQVSNKQPNEDSRVELKRTWIDTYKAAREIAGHANANRGEDILWIIGLDEKEGIIGADKKELANWLPQVWHYFKEIHPEVIDLNVQINGKTLVALLFSGDRIPFVVKNKAFGHADSGSVELEVPWREGCQTRSAKRSDLIRILVPMSQLPKVEFLGASIIVLPRNEQDFEANITAHLYLYPYQFQTLAIPAHRCELQAKIDNIGFGESERIVLKALNDPSGGKSEPLINCTKTEAIVYGPGLLDINAYSIKLPASTVFPPSDALLTVKISLFDIGKSLVISESLKRIKIRQNQEIVARWSFGKQGF